MACVVEVAWGSLPPGRDAGSHRTSKDLALCRPSLRWGTTKGCSGTLSRGIAKCSYTLNFKMSAYRNSGTPQGCTG